MIARMIQTIVHIASDDQPNTAHLNRGEGVDREIIFIIAIHPPAPEKLLQLGRCELGVALCLVSVV